MKNRSLSMRCGAAVRLCSLLLLFALILTGTCGTAFADTLLNNQINNQIINESGNTVIIGSPAGRQSGLDLVLSTGDQYSIVMPNLSSYIQPVSMYVDAPGDHSIYVYKDLTCDKEKLMPFAYEGMRVTAVAEQVHEKTAMTCIVYRDENYRLHAGWVHSKYLTSWFPGAVASIGTPFQNIVYATVDPVLSWGRDYFVNTKQKYTLLTEPVRECTQFLLNYQVTGRGGAKVEELLGPRTVYINDGSGWTSVGQFDYSRIEAILVTVNLLKPMDLLAVAVIPSCSRPDVFTFRQSVQDVLSANAGTPAAPQTPVPQPATGGTLLTPAPDTVIVTQPQSRPQQTSPVIRRGSIVTFGSYEQDLTAKGSREPIQWIVLDMQEDRVLLISRYGLDCLSFCSAADAVSWETSKIRSWLNDRFLNAAFTPEQQNAILVTEVDNSRAQGYIHYDFDGGNNTLDRLFLLSYAEAWNYFYQSSDRTCQPTKVAEKRGAYRSPVSGNCPWWLRSPGYTADHVAAVDVDGNRGGNLKYGSMAIRPAMWVDSSVFRSGGTRFTP